ncbi:MAG: sugar transferase [Acidimicrobiia bacterium]|nr:sugar transferase [Acidimicrobiia bacterium]
MRELFRSILSANLTFTGIVLTAASFAVFFGSGYLLLYTNLGKRLGFLIAGSGVFGWATINSLLFVLYAPRGPRPADFEGLNAWEIRLIPMTWMVVSAILFAGFLVTLNRLEDDDENVASSP